MSDNSAGQGSGRRRGCPDLIEHAGELLSCHALPTFASAVVSGCWKRKVMMLAHQQMGYDAAREIGEYDPGMDSLSISEDSPTDETSHGLLVAGSLAC